MFVQFLPLPCYGDVIVEMMQKKRDERYTDRMVDYKALCRATSYEVVGDGQNLYIVENLDPEEKVVTDKKVGDGVKIENYESFNFDDSGIDLGADHLKCISLVFFDRKCISLVEMYNDINSTFWYNDICIYTHLHNDFWI